MLAVTSVGQMLTTFAGSALNVGFPVIEADLDVRRTTLVWAVSGYSIAAAAFLLAAGRAADRIGGKRVFLGGIALFTIGAFLATIAPNAALLIVGRVLQGLGAAAMIPSSLSLVLHEFPLPRRSLAIAVWGGVSAIAAASGPPVGAALIELGSWRLVFATSIPLGLAALVIGARVLREPPRRDSAGRVDILSGPLASLAVGLGIAGLLQSSTWGWSDPRVYGALVAVPLLLTAFGWRSAVHPTPLMDLTLLRNRRFVTASALSMVYNASTSGYWLAAPLFLQTVWGWGVLESGLGIVGGPVVHLLFTKPMGRLAEGGHHRVLMIAGTFLSGVAVGGLALSAGESPNFWVTVFPFTVLIGFGGAMAWPTFTSAAILDVDSIQYGQANGVHLTMRQLGSAIGVAVVIAVIGNRANAGADAFRTAWAISSLSLLVCSVIVAAIYPSGEPRQRST